MNERYRLILPPVGTFRFEVDDWVLSGVLIGMGSQRVEWIELVRYVGLYLLLLSTTS